MCSFESCGLDVSRAERAWPWERTVEGNLDFGILRRTQGIERIRVMMGDQSLWILSDLVEIGNSGIRLLDLGGMSITNIKTRFCFYHLVDWINHSWDYLDHFL